MEIISYEPSHVFAGMGISEELIGLGTPSRVSRSCTSLRDERLLPWRPGPCRLGERSIDILWNACNLYV